MTGDEFVELAPYPDDTRFVYVVHYEITDEDGVHHIMDSVWTDYEAALDVAERIAELRPEHRISRVAPVTALPVDLSEALIDPDVVMDGDLPRRLGTESL